MAGLIQDLLDLELPYMFLISVSFSIVCMVFTIFFFDQRNRKKDQHLKEVSLQPIEEDVSEEEQSESELSEVEEEEEENVEEESTPTNDKDDGAAGDEEAIGLMGQLKSARLKKIEEKLTEEQLKSEKEIEQEQLQAIFELLRKQEDTMDMNPMDEKELKAQLSMYR